MTSSHAFNYGSDNEEDEQEYTYDGKDATFFVIDCNKEMFQEIWISDGEEATSRFDLCLGAIEDILLKKLRQNNTNEMYSILLYNTEKPDTNSDIIAPDHCNVLFPLQNIDVDMIRIIKNMRYGESNDYMDFANKYGHSTDAKMADVLWLCSSVLSRIKNRSLMICWFTDLSEPHPKGSTLFKEASLKAKDLTYLTPDFQLIPLDPKFNYEAFYHTFISNVTGKDEDEVAAPLELDFEGSDKIASIANRLLRQDFTHRALSYLTMEMDEKVKFGVGIYNFTRKKKEPTSIKLDRVTNEPIESRRTYKYGKLAEDDPNEVNLERSLILQEILTAEKTVKYLEVGAEKVKFTPLEVYEMKQVMQPKIKLLGFKPLSSFKQDMFIKSPCFLYPSEKNIKGSTSIFRALWESCIRNEKFALCIFTMRLKSLARVVALIPQEEVETGNTYDGFRMEYLPYSTDVRELTQLFCAEKDNEENDEQFMNATLKMVSKCTINYDPSMIKNPVNDKIYNSIESSVFDENRATFEDYSKPDVEKQDMRIASFVEEIKALIDGFEEVSVSKRKNASAGGNEAKKMALDINTEMILEKCKSGDVKNITIPMLREYLKLKGCSGLSKLIKQQLIDFVLLIE